jgi:hypothetical protein
MGAGVRQKEFVLPVCDAGESVPPSDRQRSGDQEPGIEKDVFERILFIPERSAEAFVARIAGRGMIPRLLYYCRVDGNFGKSSIATVKSLTAITGVKERKGQEDQEWDDFHVRKDPSLSRDDERLAMVSQRPHYIASVKRV